MPAETGLTAPGLSENPGYCIQVSCNLLNVVSLLLLQQPASPGLHMKKLSGILRSALLSLPSG